MADLSVYKNRKGLSDYMDANKAQNFQMEQLQQKALDMVKDRSEWHRKKYTQYLTDFREILRAAFLTVLPAPLEYSSQMGSSTFAK